MTIVVGFSAQKRSPAPLHLAVQIARTTGQRIVAAAVVEASPFENRLDRDYREHMVEHARKSLDQTLATIRPEGDVASVVHVARSIPEGLTELVQESQAKLVVIGSSSSGLLGSIVLGSVTGRLVHTAEIATVIAPRGYPHQAMPVRRLTVAYGGAAEAVKLVHTAADMSVEWGVRLRIASFTVRPALMFGSPAGKSAESLVVDQWAQQTVNAVGRQLADVRQSIRLPNVDIVTGSGTDWAGAISDIAWEEGDVMVMGSGAAGPRAQVFLGSAASRILRHVPVPAMIVPRMES